MLEKHPEIVEAMARVKSVEANGRSSGQLEREKVAFDGLLKAKTQYLVGRQS